MGDATIEHRLKAREASSFLHGHAVCEPREHVQTMTAVPVLHSATSNAVAVAAINGTILAIVIAGASGYFLSIFQSLDRMQTDLIERVVIARRTYALAEAGANPVWSANDETAEVTADTFGDLERFPEFDK